MEDIINKLQALNINEINDDKILDDMYNKLSEVKIYVNEHMRIIESHSHFNHKNLTSLQNVLTNEFQKDIIYRSSRHYDEDRLYMIDFNLVNDPKKPNILGTFSMLGTFDFKKNTRSHYDIKMYKPNSNDKGSFWCSCPDHKFNSTKKSTVCKHITFVVCQVAKVMTRHFFETKHLSEEQTNDLIKKVSKDSAIWKDKLVCRKIKVLNIDSFKEKTKVIDDEDVCPICYDDLGNHNNNNLLTCPKCTNYVHDECMMVWMEKHTRCVYCSDTVWQHYDAVKSGQIINLQ